MEVTIENLPENWKGKKIVQLSDIHLGYIYSARYMEKVAQQVNDLKPDIIVITGDLFDGTDGKLDSFVAPLNKLKANSGIFYATGNHETYLGIAKAIDVLNRTNIVMLRDEMKEIAGLQFLGIDYPERMETKDIATTISKMQNFDKQKPSVLLWHVPTQIEKAKEMGISLMLSGHTHSGQLFPFQFITSLVFHGYDYGLRKEGSFSIYTSSGTGGWGPPMRTENKSEIVEIILK